MQNNYIGNSIFLPNALINKSPVSNRKSLINIMVYDTEAI